MAFLSPIIFYIAKDISNQERQIHYCQRWPAYGKEVCPSLAQTLQSPRDSIKPPIQTFCIGTSVVWPYLGG